MFLLLYIRFEYTHTHSLSLSHTHTDTLVLNSPPSLSLSHTHTHTHTHTHPTHKERNLNCLYSQKSMQKMSNNCKECRISNTSHTKSGFAELHAHKTPTRYLTPALQPLKTKLKEEKSYIHIHLALKQLI